MMPENQHAAQRRIPLWQDGAPGAAGTGEADQPFITPYLTGAGRLAPAIIVCPGGGYRTIVPKYYAVADWLLSLGISAIVLHYRVAPYRHPVPLGDVQRAIRLVRHNAESWGIDTNRLGIMGFSAGGHLAATAGTGFDPGDPGASDPVERESSRPDLMILSYPVITFGEHRHQGSLEHLLGSDASPELRIALSAENRVSENTPPTFLWHTVADAVVPVENSLLFAAALSRNRVPYELHLYQDGAHGLSLAQDDPAAGSWTHLCAVWMAKYGFCRAT